MARTPTSTAQKSAASKAPRKQRIDLATAEQTNGALAPIRSVYDLVGLRDVRYQHNTFAAYSAYLNSKDLVELHDEAYNMALSCSPSRAFMIQRLEEKYLKENPDQRALVHAARLAEEAGADSDSIAKRAQRIMDAAR